MYQILVYYTCKYSLSIMVDRISRSFWRQYDMAWDKVKTITYTHLINLYCEGKQFKQWRSTIPPISTKRTITSHLNSLHIQKTHDIWHWNPCHGLGQTQNFGGVKPVYRIPPLHNGFSNGSVLVNKIQQETLPYTCIYILEKRIWYVRPISGFHRYIG